MKMRLQRKVMVSLSAVIIAGIALFILSGCVSGMFYYPTRTVYQTPEQDNLKYEDVTFHSKDGTALHGWFVPAVGPAAGTVVHFHGNAQNLTAHFSFVKWLPREGFNLFLFDYRGYGKSEGKPGRRGVYEDSVAAMQYVKSRTDIDQNKLLVLGQSLGGANAIATLAGNDFEGVRAAAIECTFYSYRSIVRDKIGAIPLVSLLKWPLSFVLIGNAHSPGPLIDEISPTPLVLIHGTADRVIPEHHTQWLYNDAKQPKECWVIEGGRHTEAFTKYGATCRPRLVQFFKKALRDDLVTSDVQVIQ